MKVLCSQEVVSPHLCGVVPCQVTIKASAPPGAMVCPLLVTPERRSEGHGTVQSIDFYALSCSSFRKQARNLIETAQRKSQKLERRARAVAEHVDGALEGVVAQGVPAHGRESINAFTKIHRCGG